MPVFNRYDATYYEFMRIFDAFKVGTWHLFYSLFDVITMRHYDSTVYAMALSDCIAICISQSGDL